MGLVLCTAIKKDILQWNITCFNAIHYLNSPCFVQINDQNRYLHPNVYHISALLCFSMKLYISWSVNRFVQSFSVWNYCLAFYSIIQQKLLLQIMVKCRNDNFSCVHSNKVEFRFFTLKCLSHPLKTFNSLVMRRPQLSVYFTGVHMVDKGKTEHNCEIEGQWCRG